MCLIVLGWRVHPRWPLIVAANRDEFHARPTAVAAPWPDAPQVIGGRDLEAGGTWLGLARNGRFAAVTNVREPGAPPGRISRGELTRNYLCGSKSAGSQMATLDVDAYAGFNLLLADRDTFAYCSNRAPDGAVQHLPAGIHAVSNHLLDTPWPKLTAARAAFAAALPSLPDPEAFMALLADDEIVPDDSLPATGVSLEWERMLSAIFVRSLVYGTRASTLVLVDNTGHGLLFERSFAADGKACGDVCLEI